MICHVTSSREPRTHPTLRSKPRKLRKIGEGFRSPSRRGRVSVLVVVTSHLDCCCLRGAFLHKNDRVDRGHDDTRETGDVATGVASHLTHETVTRQSRVARLSRPLCIHVQYHSCLRAPVQHSQVRERSYPCRVDARSRVHPKPALAWNCRVQIIHSIGGATLAAASAAACRLAISRSLRRSATTCLPVTRLRGRGAPGISPVGGSEEGASASGEAPTTAAAGSRCPPGVRACSCCAHTVAWRRAQRRRRRQLRAEATTLRPAARAGSVASAAFSGPKAAAGCRGTPWWSG